MQKASDWDDCDYDSELSALKIFEDHIRDKIRPVH
jgi:hypothetical protein